jgi:hexapeptide transferase family protein
MKHEKFQSDYYRMMNKDYKFSFDTLMRMIAYPHLRFMYWWRKYEKSKSFLKRLILLKYTHKYGLEISPDATIGDFFYLGHPYNITVGSGVTLGHHVNLHKGVTIGRENRGKREGSPRIGNYVWIGMNSTVVGNIHIGDDVLIAPNSFVNIDVPSHSVVIGSPAVIHSKNDAVKGYIGE